MVVSVLFGALAVWVLLPTLADALNVVWALVRPVPEPGDTGETPRFLFLIPAHNEEGALGGCLASLQRMEYPRDRRAIAVVADNCTDATAAVAAAAGVQCLVRVDPEHRGKPQALAWALERLPIADFDAVTIVDADTEVARDFAAMLARSGAGPDVAVQPYNAVLNPGANALTRMAAILSAANHLFAFRLKARAGCNIPLSAGMTLGTGVLRRHGWAAFSIGEDWEWYAQLTAASVPVRSAWRARIAAQEAVSLRQSAPQRRRWMIGKLHVLMSVGPRILRSGRVSLAQKADALAELSQPGPALHLGIALAASGAAVVLRLPGYPWVAGALAASLLRPMFYAALATARDPQPGRALLAFAYLPIYTVWRLGNALWGLLTAADRTWVRTSRTP